jgi:prepilin-type N-terminal cleavage/methylation domain-containing protein
MHWKDRRGYSLAELAVVVMIAGLILAIGTPGVIRYLNAARVRDTAKMIADEMKIARQRSVTNGTRNYIATGYGANQTQYYLGSARQNADGSWGGVTWRGPFELPNKTKAIGTNYGSYQWFYYDPSGRPKNPVNAVCSGSVKIISTVPSCTDTSTINLDLSGSVW